MQVNPLITVNIFIDPLQSTKTFTKKTIGQTHLHKESTKTVCWSRRNNKKSNHKLSTNVIELPTLSSLHYPNHKPEQKSCITKTLPSCFLDPDNQTPNNHIKPPKPKHPNPSTAQPVTTKENNHYLCTRTCNSSSSLTLVLLGPNTQSYTDNYGLNHYHPTPTTIFSTSPATYFSTNKS